MSLSVNSGIFLSFSIKNTKTHLQERTKIDMTIIVIESENLALMVDKFLDIAITVIKIENMK